MPSYLIPEIIARIAKLGLRAQRVVEGTISGLHRSPLHGLSVEFADYREYSPGDDLKRLDWRAYARSERYVIKRYEEESNLRATILLDASRSMRYGRRGVSKFDYAATLAASLAAVCVKQRDAVGLALVDQEQRTWLRPAATQAQLAKIVDALQRAQPDRQTELGSVMNRVADQIRGRGLIIIISDLLTDLDALYNGLGRLQHQGHEILIFQVLDRDEIELPFDDSILFRDIEGALGPDGSPDELQAEPWAFRKAYHAAMRAFIDDVATRCRSAAVDHLLLTTDTDLGFALSSYLHGRQRNAGLKRGGKIGGGADMHLLATPMLFGLALASVPIIIHLLNRRRFQLLEWAPMKYLKLTLKSNRRRMRIEQYLLLAIRTLVVALLFLALARPAMSRTGLGGWLASRARTGRVIVIDDSMSMGYQADRRAAFDSAKEAVAQIICAVGTQDSLTVMLTSRPDAPLVRETSITDSNKLLGQIGSLAAADSACEWGGIFKRADEALKASPFPQKELVIVTDLRRSGWSGNVSELSSQWASESVEVKIIDVGSRLTDNLVLTRLEQEDPLALPGVPLKLRASIRNDTPAAIGAGQATFHVDELSRPLVLPELPSGQTTEIPLTVTPSKSGQHLIRLTLPADVLPADDTRLLAVSVRSEINILLIDGQVGSRPFESSTDFLQLAFTAGPDPWQIARRSDAEWRGAPGRLINNDILVIANVASFTPQQVAELEKLVSAGAGVMIFGGEQTDLNLYNQQLHRDGAGLLPARLDRLIDEPANGMVVEGMNDSPLAMLAKIAPEALSRIRPRRFIGTIVDQQKDKDVRILARWNDAESHPAIIEKRFGRGRSVLFWTMSADRQWSDWPVDPTYVLAVRSGAISIARPDSSADNFTAGQGIAYPIQEGQVVRNPHITTPDDKSSQPLTLDGQVLRHAHTSRAGRYQLGWKDARDAEQSRMLGANFDLSESNLEPISEAELGRLLSPLSPRFIHWGSGNVLAESGREVWRSIIAGVLMLAALETVVAMWVGREK